VIDLNPGNLMINKSILCRSNFIVAPIFPDQSSVSSTIIFIDEIYGKLKEFCKGEDQRYRCLATLKHIVVNRFKSKKDLMGNRVIMSLHSSWIKILKKFIRRREIEVNILFLSPQFESSIMKKRDGKYSLIRNAGEEQWKINHFVRKLIILCQDFI
jgi:cellulose biosynthesis protein BcsQ